jgi:hypothetical protein
MKVCLAVSRLGEAGACVRWEWEGGDDVCWGTY